MNTKNNLLTNPWVSMGLPALTVLLGVQLLRALFPLLLYVLGDARGWSAVAIGGLALAVFALSFLANLLRKAIGGRVLLIVTVAGVGVTRLALQLWPDAPLAYLLLCMVGAVCFVWFFPVYLAALRPSARQEMVKFGCGLQLGFILAILLNGLYNSYEFNWQPGLANALLAIVLVGWQLGCLAGVLSTLPPAADQDTPLRQALPWAMIGPFFFVQLLIFLNLAHLSAVGGWQLPLTLALALLAGLAGLAAMVYIAARGCQWAVVLLMGVALLALAWFGDVSPLITAVYLILGQIILAMILMLVLLNTQQQTDNPSSASGRSYTIRNITIANGIGWLLFVIFIFLYYAGYTLPLFPHDILPPIAILLIVLAGIAASRTTTQPQSPLVFRSGVVLLLVVLAAVLFKWVTWQTATPATPSGGPVRVLTYNLHNGINPWGQLNLEAIAQTIESEDPDVIALQEVSRGWIINGSADMLQWLGQRLDMPYVWGPTEGDLWGNAIFSRYPIITSEVHALPPDDLLLHRGFILAEIDINAREPLHLIDTHYHHLNEDSAIRVVQTEALLGFWNGRPHTLVMGDLNARPDAPEMQMFRDAGFTDAIDAAGISPGYTYSSTSPDRRLDYIWYTADITAADVIINSSTASDHLGVAATVEISAP
jgi:endonuclease/exonuclease/phosphatase family metal-dependent hydrolase